MQISFRQSQVWKQDNLTSIANIEASVSSSPPNKKEKKEQKKAK